MQKIIHLQEMSYSIPYSNSILEKIELEVHEGEFLGVLGVNGAGKTTLMDLLMGFRKASSGKIEVFGEDPHAMARSHRKDVVFLSQEVGLKGSLTIREFLKFHSSFYERYDHQRESELLKSFKLKENVKIGSLSTGQQRKVQVVAGFSCASKLILIDEITAVMDPETRSIFFRELHQNRQRYGATILLATNIAEDLVERCDRIVFIEKKSAKVFLPQEIARLFNLAGAAA